MDTNRILADLRKERKAKAVDRQMRQGYTSYPNEYGMESLIESATFYLRGGRVTCATGLGSFCATSGSPPTIHQMERPTNITAGTSFGTGTVWRAAFRP